MKKIIFLIFVLVLLLGCSTPEQKCNDMCMKAKTSTKESWYSKITRGVCTPASEEEHVYPNCNPGFSCLTPCEGTSMKCGCQLEDGRIIYQ